ncbi:Nucleosomal histone H3-Lys79 methylase [Paramarasmius palmivorus]|uniref:Histone-lysine N-methyltransferase, H3 lysine-79 specific n=1 Tax=Paramarasmius palmivorus TaxID=297713 RepID=A0AAW0AWQ1_9AGAR
MITSGGQHSVSEASTQVAGDLLTSHARFPPETKKNFRRLEQVRMQDTSAPLTILIPLLPQELAIPRVRMTQAEKNKRARQAAERARARRAKEKASRVAQGLTFVPQKNRPMDSSPTLPPLSAVTFSNPVTPAEIWRIRDQLARYRYSNSESLMPLAPTEIVQQSRERYRPVFHGESMGTLAIGDKPDMETTVTVITLLLPLLNITESFPMCVPTRGLDYNPVDDFKETVVMLLTLSNASQDNKQAVEANITNALNTSNHAQLLDMVALVNSLIAGITTPSLGPSVQTLLLQQCYDRCARPHNRMLEHGYKAFSSETYGELMPEFVKQILRHCPVGPDSVVVDVGCGVGNVLAQISLETGSSVCGIEIRHDVASIAKQLVLDTNRRSTLWGSRIGSITVLEGDVCAHLGIRDHLAKADLIISNNYGFQEDLNQDIFAVLKATVKSNATIVSLAPFEKVGKTRSGHARDSVVRSPLVVYLLLISYITGN